MKMNAELLDDLKADLRHNSAWRVMAQHVKREASDEVLKAVARVVIEACAEICHAERIELFKARNVATDQKIYRAQADAINDSLQ
jgi:hypothetical protein